MSRLGAFLPARYPANRAQRGMTLIELVITIVIIGIAAAALFTAMATITGRSADPMLRQQSLAIAEAYLEEISLQAFPSGNSCPAGANGSGRSSFDNVCEYNELSYPGAQPLAPRNALTVTPIVGLEGYRVEVNVEAILLHDLDERDALDKLNALRIVVSVTDPSGQELSLIGYRARY